MEKFSSVRRIDWWVDKHKYSKRLTVRFRLCAYKCSLSCSFSELSLPLWENYGQHTMLMEK